MKSAATRTRASAPKPAAPAVVAAGATHGPSSPDQVVETIKHGILLGRFVPGQRLIEADMTRDHRVSRGPVREALKRLNAEGIVALSRHRGAYIRLLTRREVLEILIALEAVVGLAARLAALNIAQNDHRARLQAAYDKLNAHGANGDRVLQSIDRNAFYETIFHIAGNHELSRIHPAVPTQILRMQVYPYLALRDRERQFSDYSQLFDSIRTGNSRGAYRIVVRHLRRSRLQIRKLPAAAFAEEAS
nr:GntR family transcriptional regulator [Panacagrimonas sp.]